jgi:predicted thioesterase
MADPLKTGAAPELKFTVAPEHTVSFPGLPPVLATPWLIWFLEHAALDLARPTLNERELTVGTRVEIDHQAPAKVGDDVVCTARVILCDGPEITFRVEARAGSRVLSQGLHKRRIVERDRLKRRLEAL